MSQEIKEMIENIPAEVRWSIAAQAHTSTATILDAAIQEAVGPEKREEILTNIYVGSAPAIKQMIDALGFPTDNAEAATKALTCAYAVMFGPEMQSEIIDASPQKSVSRVTQCAFPLRMKEMRVEFDCFPVCTAMVKAAYHAIKPDLKVAIGDKCIRRGDAYCGEYVVEM
jgi:hypothetical protein